MKRSFVWLVFLAGCFAATEPTSEVRSMATRPGSYPTWASNTNYAGGPDIGTPTKVAPSAGRIADGWRKNDIPPAQEQNYEQALLDQWIEWLDAPQADSTKSYPLAARNLARTARGVWMVQEPTWVNVDVLTTFGALNFFNVVGAGTGAVALLNLDLPNGSEITSLDIIAQAGSGHSALPDNHKARLKLGYIDNATGTTHLSAFKLDTAANVAAYEAVHTFNMGAADLIAMPVYPVPIDNTAHRYFVQYQSEEGTGTTMRNNYKVFAIQVNFNIVAQDPGGS